MKKAVRKKKSKPKAKSLMDRLPKNRGEYLELLIKMTEKAISPTDKAMQPQADRLKIELAQWKKSNPNL